MIYFIVNPLAGGGLGRAAESKIRELLGDTACDYMIYESQYRGHAVELARELCQKEDCSGIVAVGGDGTFSEVLNGLDTSVPLGLIPCGTGNDFAAGAGISRDFDKAIKAIVGGKTVQMDYITVGDKRCINITGTGFDVDILAREAKYRKYCKSRLTYYLALFVTILSIKFRRLHVVIDDSITIDTDMLILVAANGKFFGGGMPMVPSAVTNDGLIDVLLVKKVPLYIIPKLLASFLKGNIEKQKKYVDIYRCKSLKCSVDGFSNIEVDGEIHSLLPSDIRVHSGELRIFSEETV